MRGLDDLVRAGKIVYAGLSNHTEEGLVSQCR
jgi:aryl-alcohol dehydrogenase-like predicted oxidoreductase